MKTIFYGKTTWGAYEIRYDLIDEYIFFYNINNRGIPMVFHVRFGIRPYGTIEILQMFFDKLLKCRVITHAFNVFDDVAVCIKNKGSGDRPDDA